MRAPQPFQYQGSKRLLAPVILRHLPTRFHRLIEPFAGSAAVSIACSLQGRACKYWLNDYNKALAELLRLIISTPSETAEFYESVWKPDHSGALQQFYRLRQSFNESGDARLLLYLLARCVKGSVRYNSEGKFNQSPDNRRLGTRPDTMKRNIVSVSDLLMEKTAVTSRDYREVLHEAGPEDVIYMDPPYQGVCGERDARYYSGINFEAFVEALNDLTTRGIRFAVSYDGALGAKSYGKRLPESLNLVLLHLDAGRSTQSTLLGREDITVESLYLSEALAEEMQVTDYQYVQRECEQLRLFEVPVEYGKVFKRVS